MSAAALPSFAAVMTRLADADPQAVACLSAEGPTTRRELVDGATRLARYLAGQGVREGDLVTIGLPNGPRWFEACLGAWLLGAVPNPVPGDIPEHELVEIVRLAGPAAVIGLPPLPGIDTVVVPDGLPTPSGTTADPLPERVSPSERALTSGGSTGRPKLIATRTPASYNPEGPMVPIFAARSVGLVSGPLYHGMSFAGGWQTLLAGSAVVVPERFDPEGTLGLIQEHRVDRAWFVPTMLQRIARLPEEVRARYDVSSLEFVLTVGAPCPDWLMRFWIDWVGPDVMHEAYGSTERLGGSMISGRDWLARPGSVGKPIGSQVRILDPETKETLGPGQFGDVYVMPDTGPGSTFAYVGADRPAELDGWESLGDRGYLDEDGYLYLGDRRSDMILCRGRNIYPAEIEAVLDGHPRVRSNALIGLPDDDLGQRLHAIVEADGVTEEELRSYLRERVAHYKVFHTIEFVTESVRTEAGKVRRSALRESRLAKDDAQRTREERP